MGKKKKINKLKKRLDVLNRTVLIIGRRIEIVEKKSCHIPANIYYHGYPYEGIDEGALSDMKELRDSIRIGIK